MILYFSPSGNTTRSERNRLLLWGRIATTLTQARLRPPSVVRSTLYLGTSTSLEGSTLVLPPILNSDLKGRPDHTHCYLRKDTYVPQWRSLHHPKNTSRCGENPLTTPAFTNRCTPPPYHNPTTSSTENKRDKQDIDNKRKSPKSWSAPPRSYSFPPQARLTNNTNQCHHFVQLEAL